MTTRASQPNILVVLSDQQRPDSCGVYGQRLPVTPNLDALAADGVVFDEAFTIQPVCGPSRAALQTGRWPNRIGCWRNGIALAPDADTLATRLGALGYQTGYVGKWHLASDRGANLPAGRTPARFERRPVPPERRGGYRDVWVAADALELTSRPTSGVVFDEAGEPVPLEGYRVDALGDLAIDRIGRFATDRPFVLFVSFLEPHHQNDRLRAIGPEGWAARFADFDRPADLPWWRGDWRWNYAEYLACCASIDANLGRLVEAVGDDALVVYSSDHGNHFRTRNFEYKRSCHDASIRVPLVVRGPGFRGGQRRDDLATNLDLVPTLVEAAGGVADDVDGVALQRPSGREHVVVQISESQIGRAIRTESHTFAAAAPWRPFAGLRAPAAERYVATHLYDNVVDPAQQRNLVRDAAHASTRAELSERLAAQLATIEGARPRID